MHGQQRLGRRVGERAGKVPGVRTDPSPNVAEELADGVPTLQIGTDH